MPNRQGGGSIVAALFGPERQAEANELVIGGLAPFSTVDWPGKLVATVFAQGCPWQCGYCHNPDLQDPRAMGPIRWAEVMDLLSRRVGQLDGLVFSGGEPTRQGALLPAILDARGLGFGIGLHSAGAYPARLRAVLDHVDWLGLDIKAMPEQYERQVGRPGAGERAWAALELAIQWGGPLEVRVTVDPTLHTSADVLRIVAAVKARGGPEPVLQEVRPDGATSAYRAALGGRRVSDVMPQGDLMGLTVRM